MFLNYALVALLVTYGAMNSCRLQVTTLSRYTKLKVGYKP